MPIDLTREKLLPLAEAAARLPSSQPGKRVNKSTLHRWGKRGCEGVRLEVIKIGGGTFTSAEALQRFCDAVTRQAGYDGRQ